MRRLLTLTLLLLALTSCASINAFSARAIEQWTVEIYGMSVHYRRVNIPMDVLGAAMAVGRNCTIVLNINMEPQHEPFVAAHELGHCIDMVYLNWDHNGFTDEGCIVGDHYCPPWEGYAQTYAMLYNAHCGNAKKPLGLPTKTNINCELPHPRSATPDWFVQQVSKYGGVP